MRCLIRHINHYGKSGLVYQDKIICGETLSIGRGVDQDLFIADLLIALRHALISELANGDFLLQARALSGFRINQRLTQSSPIKIGDQLRFGQTEVRMKAVPAEYQQQADFMLEVDTQQATKSVTDQDINKQTLQQQLSPPSTAIRAWSWYLFLTILLVFLVIPLSSVYLQDIYQPWIDDLEENWSTDEQSFEMPALPVVLSDRYWQSGTVASAHHFFQQDCNTCHQQAFEPVTDKACLTCHEKTYHHVDPNFFELDKLQSSRCASCHADHNGKHQLIRRDDSLCSDCHKDLKAQTDNTELEDAWDFTEQHPEFKVTLIGYEDGQETSERQAMDDEKPLREFSNLVFPHDVHVSRKGLETIDGIFRLWCDDCHIHEPDQAHFKPIDFDDMCESCHQLSFEPTDPFRLITHGKAGEVMYLLQEYYSTRALEGGYHGDGDVPDIVAQGRFPGEKLGGQDRLLALDWAKQKSEEVGADVFEFTLCVECHEVEQVQADPPRWDIIPVRINQNWFPKGRFNHDKHLTMNCVSCHWAPESGKSSDVLLPDIQVCKECHGGVHATDKLQSTCVDCHGFHVATEFTMKGQPTTKNEE